MNYIAPNTYRVAQKLVEIILSVFYNFSYLIRRSLSISQVHLQDAVFLLTL